MVLQPLFFMKLSVALATFNEEANITMCLDAVASWVDEIVIVDGGSTDQTVKLAQSYHARIIKADNPPIFHINKQKALDACGGDWVLQLDADEVVTSELHEEIVATIKSNKAAGFHIPRKNFFLGHWMRKGGQYPDYVIRLFARGKGTFPCKSVHEQIHIDGTVEYLKNPLLHYTSRTLAEYWRKAHAYIALAADELKKNKLPLNIVTYLEYNLIKPTKTFFLLFLRHKGFEDGLYGFLFALFSSLHHPLAYGRYVKSHR